LVAVFRDVRRVLRKDGTLWLNYGDAYSGGTGQALRIAEHFLVPVFNLHDPTALYRLHAHVEGGVFA
jgi:hypothetical protein